MYNQEKRIETIARILARSIDGQLTGDEQAILDAWRSESRRNEAVYERLQDKEYIREQSLRYKEIDYADGWKEIMKKIGRRKTVSLYRRAAGCAAALAVLAFAVWGVAERVGRTDSLEAIAAIMPGYSQATLEMGDGVVIPLSAETLEPKPVLAEKGITATDHELVYNEAEIKQSKRASANETAIHTLTVPRGGEYRVVLSDGTTVWLNSESSLRYPAKFCGGERRVELTGEGYFDVAHDEKKQFVVSARGVDVSVLGTEFNIMSYDDSNGVETTLVNGRVNIVTETRNVALTPGRQAVYNLDTETIDINTVDTRIYTAWKDGVFEFDGMPLESICKLLGRWYNVDFVFADPKVARKTFTGEAKRDRSLVFILNLISDTQSIKYEMSGDKILLSMK